jgi:hypothetical protein
LKKIAWRLLTIAENRLEPRKWTVRENRKSFLRRFLLAGFTAANAVLLWAYSPEMVSVSLD